MSTSRSDAAGPGDNGDASDRSRDQLHARIREGNKRRCQKNPGHRHFHCLDEIRPESLPEGYQDPLIVDCLKVCWPLTVKIEGRYISNDRPERYHDRNTTYMLGDRRGTRCTHYGGGWIWNVTRGRRGTPCPCDLDSNAQTYQGVWAAICLSTSNHVIFDTDEAKEASIKLFFDKEETDQVLSFAGHQVLFKNTEEDRCLLLCITHDMDLVKQLEDLIYERDRLLYQVNKKYAKMHGKKPVFIISYPHGCNKLISWGSITSRKPTGYSTYCFRYSAPSCPGSSGGLMWPVGRWFHFQILVHQMAARDPTYGEMENRSGMRPVTILEPNARLPGLLYNSNYFAAITSEVYPEAMSFDPCQIVSGPSQDLGMSISNAFDGCRKNPGHDYFYEVSSFEAHLPHQYRHPDVARAMKTLAELTVHVSVTYVSPNRPDTFPVRLSREMPYPFIQYRGSRIKRLGSGWVWDVTLYGESRFHCPCACRRCCDSQEPSRYWAKIKIITAAHVVFDTSEAKETKISLWYDHRDDVNSCPKLDSLRVVHCDVVSDICMMECITCDTSMAQRLASLVQQREHQLEVVESRYRHTGAGGLVVVMSHPHGIHKHITFGQCIRYTENQSYVLSTCSFAYNTETCPGSSGGVVWLVGSSRKGSYHLASHSGQVSRKKNENIGGGEFLVCRRSPADFQI